MEEVRIIVPYALEDGEIFERVICGRIGFGHHRDNSTFERCSNGFNFLSSFVSYAHFGDSATLRDDVMSGGEEEIFGHKKRCASNVCRGTIVELHIGL